MLKPGNLVKIYQNGCIGNSPDTCLQSMLHYMSLEALKNHGRMMMQAVLSKLVHKVGQRS